mmetsp:Transcript_35317/g.34333  ORF Transcript_35317/g.34333 Transcript_35317/m.34333 type:complete len:118 (-) Transcript_35317:17-370(-)
MFGAQGHNGDLTKDNLNKLILFEFKPKTLGAGDAKDANESGKKIKQILQQKKKPLIDYAKRYLEPNKQFNIRNMKVFLFASFAFSAYEIENLMEFLDKDNNGFISFQTLERFIQAAK